MYTNKNSQWVKLIELVETLSLSGSDDANSDNSTMQTDIKEDTVKTSDVEIQSDQINPNDETLKNTNENRSDNNIKNDSDFEKLHCKFIDCKYDDDCKSLLSRKSCKCSSDVCEPVCCNAICNIPKMDMVTMVAEGQGTIADAGLELEEPEEPDEAGQLFTAAALSKAYKYGKKFKYGNKCKCGNGGNVEEAEIAFKFFIGKKYSNYVGNMCLVNYNEGIFLTSDKLECFHSPDHTKFVAIFHFEEADDRSREVAVYGTTKICNILPTLFIFSAPHCGEDDVLAMGGSVTTGTIKIAKKDDK